MVLQVLRVAVSAELVHENTPISLDTTKCQSINRDRFEPDEYRCSESHEICQLCANRTTAMDSRSSLDDVCDDICIQVSQPVPV